jgi:hypothetical protein
MGSKFMPRWLVAAFSVVAAACGPTSTPPAAGATDFSVELVEGSGPIAPPYQYSHQITVDAAGQGRIETMRRGAGDSRPEVRTFRVPAAELLAFREALVAAGWLQQSWAEQERGPGRIGGRALELRVTLGGKVYEHWSSVATPEEYTQLQAFAARVRGWAPAGASAIPAE